MQQFNRILGTIAVLFLVTTQMAKSAEDLEQKIQRLQQQINKEIAQSKEQAGKHDNAGVKESLKRACALADQMPLQITSGVYSGVPGEVLRALHVDLAKRLTGIDDGLAEEQFKKAIGVPQVFGDTVGLPEAQKAYAAFQAKKGKSAQATELQVRSTAQARLDDAHRSLSSKDPALMQKHTADAISAALGPPVQNDLLFQAYRWRGRYFEQLDKYAEAEKPFAERLTIGKRMNNQDMIAEALLDLGMLAESREKFAEAEQYYRDSVAHYNQVGRKNTYSQDRLKWLLEKQSKGKKK